MNDNEDIQQFIYKPLDYTDPIQQFIYKPPHYTDPIAQDATMCKEGIEYHKRSGVQVNMSDEMWTKYMIEYMESGGWKNDRNDDKTLGFSSIEGAHHWIRDYDKKDRRFVQYDGNLRLNLKVTKESNDDTTT